MLLDADLTQRKSQQMTLVDGDLIRIPSVLDQLERVVTLSGHVERPGDYAWTPNMRLTDLIPSMAVLLPDVDPRYLIIKRENPIKRNVELFSANLAAALQKPDGPANLPLQPQDEVRVFDFHTDQIGRAHV